MHTKERQTMNISNRRNVNHSKLKTGEAMLSFSFVENVFFIVWK